MPACRYRCAGGAWTGSAPVGGRRRPTALRAPHDRGLPVPRRPQVSVSRYARSGNPSSTAAVPLITQCIGLVGMTKRTPTH
jgi:hypothetical protein